MSQDPRRRARSAAAAVVLFVAVFAGGVVVGSVWRPSPPVPSLSPPTTHAVIADLAETTRDLANRSGAIVEILNDMAEGKVSRDPDALFTLRDSMQEITADLGDVAAQLAALAR